ncbi:MAG: hypothetical protein WC644_10845 [Ignavibacteria bacterium]
MCDILYNKSEDNEKAANYLYNKKIHFPAVIHCSYYSCYQLMSYLLESFLNRDYDSIRNESNYRDKSIHSISIKSIYRDLREYDTVKASDFNDKIAELKEMRNCSDYKNENIDWKFCLKAISLLREIKGILNEKYKYAS